MRGINERYYIDITRELAIRSCSYAVRMCHAVIV